MNGNKKFLKCLNDAFLKCLNDAELIQKDFCIIEQVKETAKDCGFGNVNVKLIKEEVMMDGYHTTNTSVSVFDWHGFLFGAEVIDDALSPEDVESREHYLDFFEVEMVTTMTYEKKCE